MDNSIQHKVNNFFESYPRKYYGKGDTIISPEKDPDGVYCLTKGIVRCYALSQDGIELTLNIFKPMAFFPMQWVMNDKQDKYYYEALSEMESYCAPKNTFEKFIHAEHDVAFDLLKRIYNGLEGYMMRMESLLSGDAYIRTVTNLLIHASRFGTIVNKSVELQLTHVQIAAQSGLTRETVTREIKKLQNKGIVRYKGEVLVILDTNRLEYEIFE